MSFQLASWFPVILASALGLGFYDICRKHAVRDNSVMPVLFWATLAGSLFFLAGTWLFGDFGGAFHCSAPHWWLIAAKSLLVASSWVAVYYAMRELPISIAAPIRATSPVWTFIGSLILFHEVPTLWQGVGMAAVFCGYYCFSILGKKEGIAFHRHRGVHLIMLGTLLGAASALYDKYLLNTLQIPRQSVQLWFSIDLVIILGAAYWFRRTAFGNRRPFVWRWSVPLTGILLICADWLYFYAVSMPDIQISVLSLIRRCSCVVTFAVGSFYFRDANLKRKAAVLLLILIGVAILALASK